ncbi:MAG: hypothetical protein R3C09_03420 [Pirellulaceae bacterium]
MNGQIKILLFRSEKPSLRESVPLLPIEWGNRSSVVPTENQLAFAKIAA